MLKSPEYKDVRVTDWYYEYVKNLSESGIVSGDGTGYFNPDGNVTREQFLKMIIMAADIETDNGEKTFSDVSDDAWYKDYVLTAKKTWYCKRRFRNGVWYWYKYNTSGYGSYDRTHSW